MQRVYIQLDIQTLTKSVTKHLNIFKKLITFAANGFNPGLSWSVTHSYWVLSGVQHPQADVHTRQNTMLPS